MPTEFFKAFDKIILKFTLTSKSIRIPEIPKKQYGRRIPMPNIKTYYNAIVIKMVRNGYGIGNRSM